MDEDPKIFVDDQIDAGSDWPEVLADALQRSCCLVAVWTPRYFRSKWCLAEWHSIRVREQNLGFRSSDNPSGLVYPVIFADGESFPDEAKRIQWKKDLNKYAYPYPYFRNTELYLEFHNIVSEIADNLAKRLREIPPWDENWKSIRPDDMPPFAPLFKRL